MQVGYSAPAQAGIVSDIGLSNSEVGWHLTLQYIHIVQIVLVVHGY